MSRFVFEKRERVLHIRYPETITLPDVADFYACWDPFILEGPHAALIDMRAINPLLISPAIRRAAIEEVESRRMLFNAMLLAEARVISGTVARGVVTAFDWVANRGWKRPLANFDTMERAEAFLLNALKGSQSAA